MAAVLREVDTTSVAAAAKNAQAKETIDALICTSSAVSESDIGPSHM
jgi:hypothetical protein